MSTKYDFGYELEPGSTNEWAFQQVSEESRVLELGAAVGNLTKHLSDEKHCIVDIVELDCESGNKAAKFARKAFLGKSVGDLNGTEWFECIKEEKYNYVVILDVLEHLENPKNVLEKIKALLEPDGKVIVSVPNISNNAVLINLYNDVFNYTELGLLDRTHRYFMTYNTIKNIIDELNYNIDSINAIMKRVGTSEIANSYYDVPEEVAYAFKQRKLGNVYQYLLVLGVNKKTTIDYLSEYQNAEAYIESIVLLNGELAGKRSFFNSGRKIELEFDLQCAVSVESVRFIPMEHSCIVRDIKAEVLVEEEWCEIFPNWTTGVELLDRSYIFTKESQEMNWLLSGNEKKMRIQFVCEMIYDSMQTVLNLFKETVEHSENEKAKYQSQCNILEKKVEKDKELENEIENCYSLINLLQERVAKIKELESRVLEYDMKVEMLESQNSTYQETRLNCEKIIEDYRKTISNQEEAICSQKEYVTQLENELSIIKNTKWYKWLFEKQKERLCKKEN